jgi:hypothetical protein
MVNKKKNKNDYKYSKKTFHFQVSKKLQSLMKETREEKIMINQGMNSEGLHHKEYHSLPGM